MVSLQLESKIMTYHFPRVINTLNLDHYHINHGLKYLSYQKKRSCTLQLFLMLVLGFLGSAQVSAQSTGDSQSLVLKVKTLDSQKKVDYRSLDKLYQQGDDSVKIEVLRSIRHRHIQYLNDLVHQAISNSVFAVKKEALYTLAQLSSNLKKWVSPLINQDTNDPHYTLLITHLCRALGESQNSQAIPLMLPLIHPQSDLDIIEAIYTSLHRLQDANITLTIEPHHIHFAFQNDLSLAVQISAAALLSRLLNHQPKLKKQKDWQALVRHISQNTNPEIQQWILPHADPIESLSIASKIWQSTSEASTALHVASARIISHKDHLPLLTPILEQWIAGNPMKHLSAYLALLDELYKHKRIKKGLLRTLYKVDRYFASLQKKSKNKRKRKSKRNEKDEEIQQDLDQSSDANHIRTGSTIDFIHIRCRLAGLLDLTRSRLQKVKGCNTVPQGRMIQEKYALKVLLSQKISRKRRTQLIRYFNQTLAMTQVEILKALQNEKIDKKIEKLVQEALNSDHPKVQKQALIFCLDKLPIMLAQEIVNTVTAAALNQQLDVLLQGIKVLALMKVDGSASLLKDYSNHSNASIAKAAKRAFMQVKSGEMLLRSRKTQRPPGQHYLKTYNMKELPYSHVVLGTSRGDLYYALMHKTALHTIKTWKKILKRSPMAPCILQLDEQKNLRCIAYLNQSKSNDDASEQSQKAYTYQPIHIPERYVLYPENLATHLSDNRTLSLSFPLYDYVQGTLVLIRHSKYSLPMIYAPMAVLTQGKEILTHLKAGDLLHSIRFITHSSDP